MTKARLYSQSDILSGTVYCNTKYNKIECFTNETSRSNIIFFAMPTILQLLPDFRETVDSNEAPNSNEAAIPLK
jgi:hypothetical protein